MSGSLQSQLSVEDPAILAEKQIAENGSQQAAGNSYQRLIEQKERELRESIYANYQRIREVEKELATLQTQLQVNVGPRKHALELLRHKIEAQNEKVSAVRKRYNAAKQALEAVEAELAREEAAKEQLCSELNTLVQQSANAQLAKLEELKNHLEQLNKGIAGAQTVNLAQQGPQAPAGAAGSPGHVNGSDASGQTRSGSQASATTGAAPAAGGSSSSPSSEAGTEGGASSRGRAPGPSQGTPESQESPDGSRAGRTHSASRPQPGASREVASRSAGQLGSSEAAGPRDKLRRQAAAQAQQEAAAARTRHVKLPGQASGATGAAPPARRAPVSSSQGASLPQDSQPGRTAAPGQGARFSGFDV